MTALVPLDAAPLAVLDGALVGAEPLGPGVAGGV